MYWAYDRHERLAAARDHARAILDGLRSDRCSPEIFGNFGWRVVWENRIARAEVRYRRLCQLARRERRTAVLS